MAYHLACKTTRRVREIRWNNTADRAICHNSPLIEYNGAVTKVLNAFHVMRYHHYGSPARNHLLNALVRALLKLRVSNRRDLIEQ